MRRTRQPNRLADSLLRVAIRQMPAVPALTGSVLMLLAPAAHALVLGDISVRSVLGERLNATIPVRLGAGETLTSGCVTPGQQSGDLRNVPAVTVTTPLATRPGMYELKVATSAALYEPMYELELKLQCDGSPVVVRQYVLMLDLPGNPVRPAAAPVPVSAAVASVRTATTPSTADAPRPAVGTTRVTPAPARPAGRVSSGTAYRVVSGDTLSTIAARVRDRGVPIGVLAGMIHEANPDAFIRNDPNLIKLGSEIVIPDTRGDQSLPAKADLPTAVSPAAPATVPPAMPVGAPPANAPAASRTPEVAAPLAADAAMDGAPAEDTNAQAATVPAAQESGVPDATPVIPVTETRRALRPNVSDTAVSLPAPPQTPVETAEVASTETNPVFAALAGVGFGLLISSLLWFRGKRPARHRAAAGKAKPASRPEQPDASHLSRLSPLVTRQVEPAISVSYTPAQEDELAAEFADLPGSPAAVATHDADPEAAGHDVTSSLLTIGDITSELEELFDGTDTAIRKRLDTEKAEAALGGIADQPGLTSAPESEALDLRTLASSTTRDHQQSQTLLDALTLLERDYEEELTASQVLDMSAVREALGQEFDEATQINAGLSREATSRRKTSG